MGPAASDSEPQPFVLVLPFRPASVQGKGKATYQARLKQEVMAAFSDRQRFQGGLYVRITYFHRVKTRRADVDNIIKPILDAMTGIVFGDDEAVRQCIAERIYLEDTFTVSDHRRPDPGFDALSDLLVAEEPPHFLYVEVGVAPEQRVSFGPLED